MYFFQYTEKMSLNNDSVLDSDQYNTCQCKIENNIKETFWEQQVCKKKSLTKNCYVKLETYHYWKQELQKTDKSPQDAIPIFLSFILFLP